VRTCVVVQTGNKADNQSVTCCNRPFFNFCLELDHSNV